MNLEDYFHSIQQEKLMIQKDTEMTINIYQDNSDLEDFPNQHINHRLTYSGPTWVQMLEDVIRTLELHFGYSIKDQVYYAVKCPVFDHNLSAAPGREMHQGEFLKLLKKHPELNNGGKHMPWDRE
jgi:hypothetical protein